YDNLRENGAFFEINENIRQIFATISSLNYPINSCLDSFRSDTMIGKIKGRPNKRESYKDK
uniref:hypothetical protein n=1 Tax=uncultured Candidatus Kuenenia sp. TaxID=1048336 RepID=UPI0025FDBD1E